MQRTRLTCEYQIMPTQRTGQKNDAMHCEYTFLNCVHTSYSTYQTHRSRTHVHMFISFVWSLARIQRQKEKRKRIQNKTTNTNGTFHFFIYIQQYTNEVSILVSRSYNLRTFSSVFHLSFVSYTCVVCVEAFQLDENKAGLRVIIHL